MIEILEGLLASMERGSPIAIASIVAGHGSLPMSRRAKMLVHSDGSQRGTVGGGCIEAEVHALATEAMRQDRVFLRSYTLTETQAGAEGLNCGGTVEILVEPFLPDGTASQARAILMQALDALRRRELMVLATLVGGTESEPAVVGRGLIGSEGLAAGVGLLAQPGVDAALRGAVERESLAIMGQDRAAWIQLPETDGPRRALLETLSAPPVLFLFGGGHVSLAVAGVARLAGFNVVVVDDRPAFSNPERFPDADRTLVLPMASAFQHLDVDEGSYIVAVTRGHQHDEPVIEQALRTRAAYIGMLGSRRKVAIMWQRLRERGVSEEDLARVHAPIGLPIGADTPAEIAVSIVAQLIEARRASGRRKPDGA
ncbi:MAG: XdhC family protein [Candidatus Polarisedimenticolia bacterium]